MLIFLSRNWTFINPEDFENIISNNKILKENSLLITFDDGFYSQKDFTKEILDELGIKAIFFCIPELIMLADERKVLQFLEENLKIKYCISFQKFPAVNMKLKDLFELKNAGHVIGSHTMSHKCLGNKSSPDEILFELVASKSFFEKKLNSQIKHFAFPFGNLNCISKKALKTAILNYSFIHTGSRGTNHPNSKLICRDAINPDERDLRFNLIFISGMLDIFYLKSLNLLKSWM